MLCAIGFGCVSPKDEFYSKHRIESAEEIACELIELGLISITNEQYVFIVVEDSLQFIREAGHLYIDFSYKPPCVDIFAINEYINNTPSWIAFISKS